MSKKLFLVVAILVLVVTFVLPALATSTVNTTGHWWCFADGVPTYETPYTDPGPNGHRNAVIWCRLNYDQSDAGFLE